MRYLLCFFAIFLIVAVSSRGQSPNATLNGQVLDSSGGVIAGANVDVVNTATNIKYSTKTNAEGMYLLPELPPANYEIQVSHVGFKTIVKPDVLLNVRDAVVINFTLPLGAVSERVTVEGGAPLINTQDAAVSTVVDRQFAENIPMNGRSFQTLIQLAPGVVLTPSTASDSGQFSVNGQRANANYWMVDGVSANIGASSNGVAGNGLGGALPSFSVQGGTNSLVSVDALQEFRIQTSTYAPEFGRTPGAQISILTRSGTNQFHGTLFDYLRNDILDANDWFTNSAGLRKPMERQNDFGGTFSGPILKDRTFFFFSYEGLRLRLPQTALTTVPDLAARQAAISVMKPFLNAYPVPNGADNLATGVAQFNATFSNPAALDAYSLRVDHKLKDKISLFARYNYSPSSLDQRGLQALSDVDPARITTQTATIGATWLVSSLTSNDFRFNYSHTDASSRIVADNFGGATPVAAVPFPSPFSSGDASFAVIISGLTNSAVSVGKISRNTQRQFNIIDNMTVQKNSHNLKFGIDYRRLTPEFDPPLYRQIAVFRNVASAETGSLLVSLVQSNLSGTFLLRNVGAFAQDTWRLLPRLTLTYGIRWDVDFSPSTLEGPNFIAVTGFDLNNLSKLALAPPGTPPYDTRYGNIAPRLGVAYQISQNERWMTVFRGGFGEFFDLATQEVGNSIFQGQYPFGSQMLFPGGQFPLDAIKAAPPPVTPASLASGAPLGAFDPRLRLPYTLQWNVSLEQSLGKEQVFSASYIGAAGRRLIQSAKVGSPNPSFATAILITNAATSDYESLQLQFQRRLSHGFQALTSYTWSHSIDTASAGSSPNFSNLLAPGLNPNANRGPSDFDIRNAFSAALTYDLPSIRGNTLTRSLFGGWSLQNIFQVRSDVPVDILDIAFLQFNGGIEAGTRPDIVPGQPLYLYGAQCASVMQTLGNLAPGQRCPGGKGFNPNAFADPPTDPTTGNPTRQGDLSRNALRGFGAFQWDFALHREFPLRESLKLQFRAEMFNVLNHPNFGPPNGQFLSLQNGGPAGFGVATQTLGQSLIGFGNLG